MTNNVTCNLGKERLFCFLLLSTLFNLKQQISRIYVRLLKICKTVHIYPHSAKSNPWLALCNYELLQTYGAFCTSDRRTVGWSHSFIVRTPEVSWPHTMGMVFIGFIRLLTEVVWEDFPHRVCSGFWILRKYIWVQVILLLLCFDFCVWTFHSCFSFSILYFCFCSWSLLGVLWVSLVLLCHPHPLAHLSVLTFVLQCLLVSCLEWVILFWLKLPVCPGCLDYINLRLIPLPSLPSPN